MKSATKEFGRLLRGALPFSVVNPNPQNLLENILSYNSTDDAGAGTTLIKADGDITVGKDLRLDNGGMEVGTKFDVSSDGVITFGDNLDNGQITWDAGKAIMGGLAGHVLELHSGGSLTMTLDTYGRVGVGGAAADWRTTLSDKILQLGNRAALYSDSNLSTVVSNNVFIKRLGGYYARLEADLASQYTQYQGKHTFQIAETGTADSQITSWITPMVIASNGKVFINNTSNLSTANLNIETGGSAGGLKLIAGFTPGNGNDLGSITFAGEDSANDNSIGEASIVAKATAAHSGSTAATSLLFNTKPSSLGPGSSPVEAMRIDENGNVGINQINPQYKLDVDGTVNVEGQFRTAMTIASPMLVEVTAGTYWSLGWWQAADNSWWLLGKMSEETSGFTRADAEFYVPLGMIADVPSA